MKTTDKAKAAFGARIKSLREQNKWTQEFLAEKIEISTNYLSSIERGKENPTFDLLVKLSAGLEVEMWELFDFGHESGPGELKEMLKRFGSELSQEKLRLAVKVLRAMAR
jgi:transcriptional regulator with XRE-family HTH domain